MNCIYLCETWYFHSFICETNARECHGMKWNGAEKMLPQMTQAQRREMFKHNKIEEKLVFFFFCAQLSFVLTLLHLVHDISSHSLRFQHSIIVFAVQYNTKTLTNTKKKKIKRTQTEIMMCTKYTKSYKIHTPFYWKQWWRKKN